MATGLSTLPQFSVHENAVDIRWKKWVKRLDNLLVGMNIKDKDRKRAFILHFAGDEVNDIFDTLPDTGNDYKTAVERLTEYFVPKKNTEFEVFKFRQTRQMSSENIDSFHTRLRQLGQNCEFVDCDKEIKSQIIQGCSSTKFRRRALQEDMDLHRLIAMARSMEISHLQAQEIEKTDRAYPQREDTNAVKRKSNGGWSKQNRTHSNKPSRVCRNCGGNIPHNDKPCPAKGKVCHSCKKYNHFSKVCKCKSKKLVKQVEDKSSQPCNESSSDEYLYGIQTINQVKSKQPNSAVTVDGLTLNILVDTGSSINVMEETCYNKIRNKKKLQKASTKLFA
ncbi:uncharacterized protein LOC117338519 [Pecten maximus]|uniref:uncharacterized protein LOC117338519 n=1 Tax=Pecten maximus TaxID=6579 RepID=UPI0014587AE6|nr:uncharacterized protein LOC117338519 [Pecten maximus]